MKSKLIFRIIGALASALIAVSVFIPFVSVTGYSQSLWQANESVGTLYLPIMIIVFGVIGIVVFSTGFKTELAYSSAGALVFFLILQTIPIIDQNSFNTLSIGYYGLVLGVILIIVMSFLCGLKVKQKVVVEQVSEQQQQEVSMLDQIDKLYNDNSVVLESNDFNSLDSIIQPLPSGVSMVNPISVQSSSTNLAIPNNNFESVPSSLDSNLPPMNPQEIINDSSMVDNFQNIVEPLSNIEQVQGATEVLSPDVSTLNNPNLLPVDSVQTNTSSELNNLQPVSTPVALEPDNIKQVDSVQTIAPAELNNSQQANPVVAEFDNIKPVDSVQTIAPAELNNSQQANPVVAEFDNVKPVDSVQTIAPAELNNSQQANPVVEFTNDSSNSNFFATQQSESNLTLNQTQLESNEEPIIEPLQPLSPDKKIDVMSDTQNNTSNLDIFG